MRSRQGSSHQRDIPDYGRLANAEACDETTGVDGAEVTIDTADHEDGDSDGPEGAEETDGPDSANAIANHESTAIKLEHSR